MNEKLTEISSLLQAGKAGKCKKAVKAAVDEGIDAQTILNEALLSGMDVVGRKFKANEIFVPEVLVAARCMNKSLDVLKPLLLKEGSEPVGTVILGTVKGDLHDIGKNLVNIMMQGKGLTVIDLGVDVPAEKFVEAAKENNADIVACSALLTTTMGEMQGVVDAVKASDLADKVKIMIGGAPITSDFCEEIGADVYSVDGSEAAEAAYEICVA
ncbi:MAG: cobalamin-binding protein [Firmicutes bacterium]|nr:cobalamin-binding protein [Bacillota bacterium]